MTDWGPGELDAAREQMQDRLAQSVDTMQAAWSNWDTLTAAQKDNAMRLTLRVAMTLARFVVARWG